MINRRRFLSTVGTVGSAALFSPCDVLRARLMAATPFFGLHPFIDAHPEAVFIKRTRVPHKTDAAAKQQEGYELATEIFMLRETPGIPLSHRIAIKPNLTCTSGTGGTEAGMGIITDSAFVEGIIGGIKHVGFPASRIYLREGNWLGDGYCPRESTVGGYLDVAARTGVHLTDFDSGRQAHELSRETLQEGSEVTWVDCRDGVVFRRIGYVAPINQPDTWLLNIAKFKTHGMGMTLCCKNHQGSCIHPHIHFCEGVANTLRHPEDVLQDFQPDLDAHVQELHAQHVARGVARWDRPGTTWNSGYGMEMWAQRTLDNLSVTDTGFCIIEGIYGRNGNGFTKGPGPNDTAEDFLTNILIFGKDPVRVDIIGTWLSGHEPGNFGLFHAALDRGLSNVLDPRDIPLYLWNSGTPTLSLLAEFERTPLLTYYLRRDYPGSSTYEPYYHLVDEPFDYSPYHLGLPVPDPVADLKVSASGRTVLLNWSKANRANAYRVEYNSDLGTGGAWKSLAITSENSIADAMIEGETRRFYRIVSLP
ncbi:MAG: DUF362 domain-containing protein [Verrucomicrobia bacterium]|jgi:uncharacterized protein (DUF362 family)|nr:DUF362 domain-containing protein [Verrucomicrobiota bacterium]OQC63353.1 MAG: hypothetical protein BWX48_03270 [Verrucomicrobia bacterium ADurb.Bin006]MDI9379680.1 DUF362 domain-containing protein [Verrucomicrobiota bacterium]NMD19274.1 DUF362 domain-containing protein [Verrucomicrobiota bacterium]HOA60266.1 DUF362 domain-containing protein [Verrucomicrobiota bacterium]